MKTYTHKGRVIRENELKEIELPKVGDKLRFKINNFCCADERAGAVVVVKDVIEACLYTSTTTQREGPTWCFHITDYLEGLEPVVEAPVCPPELLPLPEGAVYLGVGAPGLGISKYARNCVELKWKESSKETNPHGHYSNGGWSAKSPRVHYATTAGDSCHRAQPWFDESQVPIVAETPVDHTKGGKYRILDVGEIFRVGDEHYYAGEWQKIKSYIGDTYRAGQWESVRRPLVVPRIPGEVERLRAENSRLKNQLKERGISLQKLHRWKRETLAVDAKVLEIYKAGFMAGREAK